MFHENNSQRLFGGVDLGRRPRKNLRMELKQIDRSRKQSSARLPIEIDNEIELIDLSNLTGITSKEDAELLDLNRRPTINHPAKWEINGSGGSRKIYQDGSIELSEKGTSPYHEIYPKCDTQRHDICSKYRAPPYRTITGACVRPTQISSLLSQNIDGGSDRQTFAINGIKPTKVTTEQRPKRDYLNSLHLPGRITTAYLKCQYIEDGLHAQKRRRISLRGTMHSSA